MSVKIEFHFEDVKKAQDFLNNLNNVPAVHTASHSSDKFARSAVTSPEVVAEQKQKNAEVTAAVEKIAVAEGAPDFAAVKKAVLTLSQAKDSDTARAVLKQFNDKNDKPCEKVTAVAESDYPALLDAVKAAM